MRSFFSPAEIRLLEIVSEAERAVIETLMRELDARLEGDDVGPNEQATLFATG